DQERTALDLTLQYAPTEQLSFTLHAMSLEMQADNTNTSLYLFSLAGDNVTCHSENAAGLCTSSTTENSTVANKTFNQTWGRKSSMSSDTFDFNTEYEGEGFRLSANVGSTKADGGTDLTTNFSHFTDDMSLWQGSIDATGKEIVINPTLD